ncbi:hypothetical protein CICLE_v10014060mg [Citrus x clementina]|uniref:Phorbol-ester/DAG-type domain-containing protein n=2 Tax=Citrus TaxID=2706 RepID=V4U723_CITCL|nr:uncharacterized protein LOC18050925 [Citrus x clementina]ESR61712.1 hypothetical protein CICLE_v10014060mg [Citrus x clementina]GAY47530.1 hypothetical protein CUMW_105130 [Citrus unshiu]
METERNPIHEHPLTLCEIEDDKPPCPVCDWRYCFDGSNCDDCEFHPEKCSACDRQPSGSFYFCKQCWPKSPFFHKLCAELPRQIRIALRPHCVLRLRQESVGPDMSSFLSDKAFDCDYCDESHKDNPFLCCDFCNFQIGAPCATTLIKYHRGQEEHIRHFSHRHPLILLDMESEAEDTKCKFCCKNIHGSQSYYCCGPCNFYIHKSCSELLQQVRHPFHPCHSLTLQNNDLSEWYRCDACRSYIDLGMRYRCDDCDFDMHPECMSLKPNIKYPAHQHLLIVVEDMSYESQCHGCSLDIEGTFFARCVECKLDFHVQCGPAPSLPPTVVHKSHSHPLSLIDKSETLETDDATHLYCDACKEETNPSYPCYGCSECDQYYAHVRCVITEIHLDNTERHKHLSHHHLLALLENERNDDIECHACENLIIQGHSAYGCDPCRFYLHKSCFELPKVMKHISDSHYLTLQNSSFSERCTACGQQLKGNAIYHCETCDFDLDLDCAAQHPSIKLDWKASSDDHDENRDGIRHYSHYHHLTVLDVGDAECQLCHKNIHGTGYGCTPCMFNIHESCAELPQEVRHPFHPRHSLTVQENTFQSRYFCDACRFDVKPGLRYRCDECDFDLHLECLSLKANIRYEDHQHLLILIENMSCKSKCEACRCDIEGTFFLRCVECKLNFHVQCGPDWLPPSVDQQHHDHPLTLTTGTIVKDNDGDLLRCEICKEERNPNHPSYGCVECGCHAHVRCVITEVPSDEREKLNHFSHDHCLFLVGNQRDDDGAVCYACEKLVRGQPTYGCDQCRFYLHKSCAELPRQIQHALHRHSLILKSHTDEGTKEDRECGACLKKLSGFFYQCDNCFVIDIDCAKSQFGGDKHRLTVFEKIQHTPKCGKYISTTHGALNSDCMKCKFRVYLLRSPLPPAIEDRSHQHPLILTDNVADKNYYTQVCDVCEEERDPELCVYYCAKCDFIAEFDCVISEVLLALQEQPRDVPFRTISRKTSNKVKISERITYQNIQNSFTDEEDEKWEEIVEAFNEEKEEILEKFSGAGHEAKVSSSSRKFVYSDEDSDEHFLQRLAVCSEKDRVPLLADEDFNSEVIQVGGYKTIPKLAGVLKSLLDKYGDIGASCSIAQGHTNLKMCVMVNFCSTVHSMCNTMIQDVNYGLLYTWWRHFNMAHRTGFKVDFFFDRLRRIAQARYRIDNDQLRNSPINFRYEEMAKLSKEIDGLAGEIDLKKENLELLRKQIQDDISNIAFEKLRLDTEELSKARETGIMKAGMHTQLL